MSNKEILEELIGGLITVLLSVGFCYFVIWGIGVLLTRGIL